MEDNQQLNNNQKTGQVPGTLEVYKESRGYKFKTWFSKMTPKKKLLLAVLPVLLIVIGLVLYFTLAAPDPPDLELIWTDTGRDIAGTEINCGTNNKSIDIIVSNPLNSGGENNDIVSVAAFLHYDPAKIEVTSIAVNRTDFPIGEGDVTPTTPGSMQKIDNVAGLLQVVRGIPADPTNGGFTAERGVLATINFNVKQDVLGDAIFWFDQTSPNQTVFVYNGGGSEEPGNVDVRQSFKINCCPAPNDTCLSYQFCPGGNWFDEPSRCCRLACSQGVELYLYEPKLEVSMGTPFTINLSMQPDYINIRRIQATLQIDNRSLLGTVEAAVATGVDGTATVSGNTITFNINHGPTNSSAVKLGTIRMVGANPGVVKIEFTGATAEIPPTATVPTATTLTLTSTNNGQLMGRGGEYTITRQKVRLCQDTTLSVSPTYDSVDFALCTEPTSRCRLEIPALGASGGFDDRSNEKNHSFTVTGLQSGTDYNYTIVCERGNYEDLNLSGTFTTASRQELVIQNERAASVQATKAIIEWNTVGGQNGDGKSDSYLCYRVAGSGGAYILKKMDVSVVQHGISLTGLTPSTESNAVTYEAYAGSVIPGNRTSANSSCPLSCPANSFTCAVSGRITFTTKTADEEPDANVVLKVSRDRVCDQWLYCDAATRVLDTTKNPPEYKDICFKTGLCDKMDEGGGCVSILEDEKAPLTKESPRDIAQIKNMSGFAKVGLDWGKRCLNTGKSCRSNADCGAADVMSAKCVDAKIDGYYPYSQMVETGLPVGISNAGFEDWSERPWELIKGGVIENYADPENGINRVLKVTSRSAYDGAVIKKLISKLSQSTAKDTQYVISFRAKTDDPVNQDIFVELDLGNSHYEKFSYFDPAKGAADTTISLSNSWQYYVATLSVKNLKQASGSAGLAIVAAGGTNRSFYIDNVSMKAVLDVGDKTNYVPRSCRLYPTENAPACDYYDEQTNKDYKGWKGYCVETDPKYQERKFVNQPMCLLWWPVDIISGEANMFSKDSTAGYTGRKPLYYCMEAVGNYKRCGSSGVDGSQICGSKYELENYYPGAVSSIGCELKLVERGVPGVPYTFYVCQDKYLTTWPNILIPSGNVEYGLKEYEVDSIVLVGQLLAWGYPSPIVINRAKFGTSEELDWGVYYTYTREDKEGTHEVVWRVDAGGLKGEGNRVSFKAHFDRERGLYQYSYNSADDTGEDNEDEAYVVKIYLREPCTKIVKVVDEYGESKPWAQRINSQEVATDVAGWLGYKRIQDYAPYGSSAVPSPSDKPDQWNEPLFVEPADKVNYTVPYQVRAGSPYGIRGSVDTASIDRGWCAKTDTACALCDLATGTNCSCSTGTTSYSGTYSGDCRQLGSSLIWYCVPIGQDSAAEECTSDSMCQSYFGTGFRCLDRITGNSFSPTSGGGRVIITNSFGPPTCISGTKTGSECPNGNQDCGMDMETGEYGKCIGFNKPDNMSWNEMNSRISQYAASRRLRELFAKSYGVWEWRYSTTTVGSWQYVKVEEDWDITGLDATRAAYYPKVGYIGVDRTDIFKQGSVILKFTSWVDPNHEPLTRYSVDWGDGSESSESGLRISGHGPSNPHILVHYYKYPEGGRCPDGTTGTASGKCFCVSEASGNYCIYRPSAQIEDNWGLCNGNGNCSDEAGGWTKLSGEPVTVFENEGFGILDVGPQTLDFYHNAKGYILSANSRLSFTIKNTASGLAPIDWTATVTNGGGFLATSSLSAISGTVDPGEQARVSVTITSPGTLGPGMHTGTITIKDAHTGQEQKVTVNLTIGNQTVLPPSVINAFVGSGSDWTQAIDNNSMTAAMIASSGEAIFSLDTNPNGCTRFNRVMIYVGRTGVNAVTGFCAEVGTGRNSSAEESYDSLGCDDTVENGWLEIDIPGIGACGYFLRTSRLTNGGGSQFELSELVAVND